VLQDGSLLYEGGLADATANGAGKLYEGGALVYSGEFAAGVYQGEGALYRPDGSLRYTGGFAQNLFNGAGKLYNETGGLLYEGDFTDGVFHGEGKLYGETGGLLYEGGFSRGLYDGEGTEYDIETGFQLFEGKYRDGRRMEAGTEFDGDGQPVTPPPPVPREGAQALLGHGYAEISGAYAKAGTPLREQPLADALLCFDDTSGYIYRFSMSKEEQDEGAGELIQIFFCGLSAIDGIVVGADLSDVPRELDSLWELNTAEQVALGFSNSLWGREVPTTEVSGTVSVGEEHIVIAYYHAAPPEPPAVQPEAIEAETEEATEAIYEPLPSGKGPQPEEIIEMPQPPGKVLFIGVMPAYEDILIEE
jgi:hypothetical protein